MLERFRGRPRRPLVYGHRGASAHATENTIDSVHRARADGADGVEVDVRLAACGEVVVFHDDDLLRLAGINRRVDSMSRRELGEISLVGGGTISTLEEILEAAHPMIVNVEIKTPGPTRARAVTEATLRVVRRVGRRRERVLVSSFDPTILLRLARRDRALALGLLFHHKQTLPLRRAWFAPIIGVAAVHPFEGLVTAASVRSWRRSRRLVNTWTVDDLTRARELAAIGVDGIISNDPAAVLASLESDSFVRETVEVP